MMVSLLFEDAQSKNNERAEEQGSLMKNTRCGSMCFDLCKPRNGFEFNRSLWEYSNEKQTCWVGFQPSPPYL
jgi:hypothetical protein